MDQHSVQRPLRVMIVDDHPMMLQGTCLCLEQAGGIEVVGTLTEGTNVLARVKMLRPDVLILDVHLPGINGVEVARQLRAEVPDVGILILTGYDDTYYVRELLGLGVRGHLHKTAACGEIVAAVQSVAAGQLVVGPAAAETALDDLPEPLSPRELEVLALLASGQRNAEIAELLHLSLKTVEFHVSHLLQKLGVRSRAEAIIKAQRYSFASPPRGEGDSPGKPTWAHPDSELPSR